MFKSYTSKTISLGVVLAAGLMLGMPACGGGESDDDGGSGGSGGGGGGSGGGSEMLSRKVENCEKYPTVADVEKNIITRSCAGAGCHRGESAVGGDYRTPAGSSFAEAFLDKKTTDQCKGEDFFDKDEPENSVFYRILQDNPKCPDGSSINAKMPPPNAVTPITAEQKKCLEEYVKTITKD